MSEHTPVIEVVEQHHTEVAATGADVALTLSEAKFFSGTAALQQAGEVRKLVEALVAVGIAETDVGIASVHVKTSKGMLLKSSSATYGVSVRCREPNKVAAVIDAIAGVKNCTLGHVAWRYEVPDSVRNGWLATCVQKARGAADAMAQALGAHVSYVYRVVDETMGPSPLTAPRGGYEDMEYGSAPRMRMQRVADTLEGLELAPKEDRKVRVRVWFAIAGKP